MLTVTQGSRAVSSRLNEISVEESLRRSRSDIWCGQVGEAVELSHKVVDALALQGRSAEDKPRKTLRRNVMSDVGDADSSEHARTSG
jgi:hypothetical protein